MKVKVPAHTRNGKKVKGYTYERGVSKRKTKSKKRYTEGDKRVHRQVNKKIKAYAAIAGKNEQLRQHMRNL